MVMAKRIRCFMIGRNDYDAKLKGFKLIDN